jgi:hypothetical protein
MDANVAGRAPQIRAIGDPIGHARVTQPRLMNGASRACVRRSLAALGTEDSTRNFKFKLNRHKPNARIMVHVS